MALLGGGVNIAANGIAEWLGSSKDEEERRQRLAVLREYQALGQLLPEEEDLVAREIERSGMQDVKRDPTQEGYLDETQARLMDRARDGRSAQGALAYEQARQRSAQEARSAREGAVADAAARGMGPEAGFTASLLAQQGDADRERMAGLQEAASAEDLAVQSLADAGSLASQRSAQHWQEDADVAGAIDDMRRFNAGEFNRFQLANREDQWNRFNAQMGIADRTAGARRDVANMYGREGDRVRQQVGGVGQAFGYGMTAYGQGGQGASAPKMAQPQSYAGDRGIGADPAMRPSLSQQRAAGFTTDDDPRRRKAR